VLVGFLASQIIDAFGWQALFYIGGILPICLCAVLVKSLPDSVSFMVTFLADRRSSRSRDMVEIADLVGVGILDAALCDARAASTCVSRSANESALKGAFELLVGL
jgi:hypothetical protein